MKKNNTATTEVLEVKESASVIKQALKSYITTKNNNMFRTRPIMTGAYVQRKAPENTTFEYTHYIITGDVKFYALTNGFFLSSMEEHILSER